MKNLLSPLTLACILPTSLAAFAQDTMKQDSMKKDDSQNSMKKYG